MPRIFLARIFQLFLPSSTRVELCLPTLSIGEMLPISDHLYNRRSLYADAGLAPPLLSESNDTASEAERSSSRRARGFLDALVQVGGSGFTSISRRRSVHHHATGVLEEPQNGMEIHAAGASSVTGTIGVFNRSRCNRGPIQVAMSSR